MEEIGAQNRYFVNFRLFYLIVQVIGVVIFVLVATWVGIHLGGLAWTSQPSVQFNWHPILMTLGMVLLYGNGKYACILIWPLDCYYLTVNFCIASKY